MNEIKQTKKGEILMAFLSHVGMKLIFVAGNILVANVLAFRGG
jgi:hypothetical protein